MNRRGFLQAIAGGMSAAILPSGVIMPIRKVLASDVVPVLLLPGEWVIPRHLARHQYAEFTAAMMEAMAQSMGNAALTTHERLSASLFMDPVYGWGR